MSNELLNILLSVVSVILTGLASWGVGVFTKWLNTKISDQKAATYLSTISTLVVNCVNEVTQTYVQSLKDSGSFDEAAQKEALQKCLTKIEAQLAPSLAEYITENFGDLTDYLTTLIESAIYQSKVDSSSAVVSA